MHLSGPFFFACLIDGLASIAQLCLAISHCAIIIGDVILCSSLSLCLDIEKCLFGQMWKLLVLMH